MLRCKSSSRFRVRWLLTISIVIHQFGGDDAAAAEVLFALAELLIELRYAFLARIVLISTPSPWPDVGSSLPNNWRR